MIWMVIKGFYLLEKLNLFLELTKAGITGKIQEQGNAISLFRRKTTRNG